MATSVTFTLEFQVSTTRTYACGAIAFESTKKPNDIFQPFLEGLIMATHPDLYFLIH